jgi:hypothetical protein
MPKVQEYIRINEAKEPEHTLKAMKPKDQKIYWNQWCQRIRTKIQTTSTTTIRRNQSFQRTMNTHQNNTMYIHVQQTCDISKWFHLFFHLDAEFNLNTLHLWTKDENVNNTSLISNSVIDHPKNFAYQNSHCKLPKSKNDFYKFILILNNFTFYVSY